MTLVVFLFYFVDTLMLSKVVLALIVAMLHIGTWLIGANKQEIHVSVSQCRKHDFSWHRQPIPHVSCFLALALIYPLSLCMQLRGKSHVMYHYTFVLTVSDLNEPHLAPVL